MKKSPEEIIMEAVSNLSDEEIRVALNNLNAKLNTNEKDLNTNKENNKATFYKILDFLTREFEKADQDMQGYLTITLKKAFPEYEEYINQTRE